MSDFIQIHPDDPQERLVKKVVADLKSNAIMAYPTTSGYALGCALGNNDGIERIRKIRDLQEKQDFSLMCSSISQASTYARIDNSIFQTIKNLDRGKYTFLLKSLPDLPRKTQSKRRTVGIRIASKVAIANILEELGEPILSTSLLMPNDDDSKHGYKVHHGWSKGLDLLVFNDVELVKDAVGNLVDIVIESGEAGTEPTTVVDLSDSYPFLVRLGSGEIFWD